MDWQRVVPTHSPAIPEVNATGPFLRHVLAMGDLSWCAQFAWIMNDPVI